MLTLHMCHALNKTLYCMHYIINNRNSEDTRVLVDKIPILIVSILVQFVNESSLKAIVGQSGQA